MNEKEIPLTRLDWGEAWMMCRECMGKLYCFDGHEDRAIPCPHPKKCEDERSKTKGKNTL